MRKMMLIAMIATLTVAPSFAASREKKTDAAAVASTMAQGRTFMQKRNYYKAMAAFEKADKISHHTCGACLLELFEAQRRGGYLADALDTAKKAVKEAGDDKMLAAKAHLIRGVLLGEMATKPSDKKNAEAANEMRQAIALDPSNAIAYYDLGYELMKAGNDTDGIAELKTYVGLPNAEPRFAEKARLMISDPKRAREEFAPDFAFTSLEGEAISLAGLRGKVGLLDFWGTWCPPCRESVPTLVRLHKEFAGQAVEFVGISSDSDEPAWRAFIAKNHMDWPEYLDASGAMQNTFGVDSFPTYFVLNRDGVIRFRQSGFGEETDVALEDAIKKALKEKPEAGANVSANSGAGAGSASASPATSQGVLASAPTQNAARVPAGTQGVRPSMVVTPAGTSAAPPPPDIPLKPPKLPTPMQTYSAMNVHVIPPTGNPDVASYLQRLMMKLSRNLIQALISAGAEHEKGTVTVQVLIDHDGRLKEQPEVVQPAKQSRALNKTAVHAVTATFPFEALPESYASSQLELRVTFFYNEPASPPAPQVPAQKP